MQFTGDIENAKSILNWIEGHGAEAQFELRGEGKISVLTFWGAVSVKPGMYLVVDSSDEWVALTEEDFYKKYTFVVGSDLSDPNRAMIYTAYSTGDGDTVTLASRTDHIFEGYFDNVKILECTEIDGVLYTICPTPNQGCFNVLVGDEINSGSEGVEFSSYVKARDYIREITTK